MLRAATLSVNPQKDGRNMAGTVPVFRPGTSPTRVWGQEEWECALSSEQLHLSAPVGAAEGPRGPLPPFSHVPTQPLEQVKDPVMMLFQIPTLTF